MMKRWKQKQQGSNLFSMFNLYILFSTTLVIIESKVMIYSQASSVIKSINV
uniref:Uncharacterized protein n=1 Tax=Solanum tuberosum TaxID=4113 RepID=M0ZZM9_SOLTU